MSDSYPDPDGTPRRASVRFKVPFISDETCFVAESDARDDTTFECHGCGAVAIGANFQEFFAHPTGQTAGTVQFSCGCDGASSFGISSASIFPQWRIVAEISPGVFKIVKRTKQERERLIRGEATGETGRARS